MSTSTQASTTPEADGNKEGRKGILLRTTLFLAILLAVIGGLGAAKYQQIQEGMAMMAASGPPPSSVEITTAKVQNWQPRVAAVGTLTAREGIDVAAEVEGVIEEIHFQSGQQVKKGDLLITLNDDVEQADLASLLAQKDLSKKVLKRSERVWREKAIPESEYDEAKSNLKTIVAQVAATRARIAKKSIRAPFSGVLGIRMANLGEYVSPGKALVSLQDSSILFTDFAVPERYLPDIQTGLKVDFHSSAYSDRVFTGELQAIDAKVDEGTRNIRLRASLPNHDGLLRPGMYADIFLILNKPAERILVPTTAIIFSSFGDALFTVVNDEEGAQVAKRIQVTTGEQRGDQVAILSGLSGGETIVQAGTSKLSNGTHVVINEHARLKD